MKNIRAFDFTNGLVFFWPRRRKQKNTYMTVLSSTKMSQLWAGQEMVWRKTQNVHYQYSQHFFLFLFFLKKRLYVYLSHPFFYDLGSQVITPTLHAELVSTLQAGKILYNTSMSTLYGLKTGHGATHQKQLCIWSDSTEDAWQLSDRYWGRGKKMTSQYG